MSSTLKRFLLAMASVKDIATIPGQLFANCQICFFADPVNAAFKAQGVEQGLCIQDFLLGLEMQNEFERSVGKERYPPGGRSCTPSSSVRASIE